MQSAEKGTEKEEEDLLTANMQVHLRQFLSFCTSKARSTFVPVERGGRDADSEKADDGGVADARGGVLRGLEVVELARLVQQVGGVTLWRGASSRTRGQTNVA